jgi:hypothetical protein
MKPLKTLSYLGIDKMKDPFRKEIQTSSFIESSPGKAIAPALF